MSTSPVSTSEQSRHAAHTLRAPDLLLLIGINIIWGLNLVTSKLGLNELPAMLFSALRLGVVGVLLLPLLRWFPGQMLPLVLATGFTGAVSFGLLVIGLSMAKDVSIVAIATQLGVPFTTLLSIVMLGETIRWRRTLGITLAFAGVMVIGFDARVFTYWPALIWVIGSALAGSLGMMYAKRLRGIGALQYQSWIANLGWPLLLITSFVLEREHWGSVMSASRLAWGAVLFSALGSSLVAHSALFYLIKRYPVTSVSPLTLLSPLFGMLFGVTLLDDQLTARMLLGGAISLAGVLIVSLREHRLVETAT